MSLIPRCCEIARGGFLDHWSQVRLLAEAPKDPRYFTLDRLHARAVKFVEESVLLR